MPKLDLEVNTDTNAAEPEATPIVKPPKFSFDRFKTNRTDATAAVEALQIGLPHYKVSQAGDFIRLHPDEDNYWSPELAFVPVPILGQKKDSLHMIDKALAEANRIEFSAFRLALATKPGDVFFLAHVPSTNLDNKWNESNLQACEQAKTLWLKVASAMKENVEAYRTVLAADQDAFPEPKWPQQSLAELVDKAFEGRQIDDNDHPALLRLVGKKQSLA